ncbi:hypothetical protein ACMVV9_004659, partial [Escherichia coli]|nr:hypothetical protein [Escherichia coli]
PHSRLAGAMVEETGTHYKMITIIIFRVLLAGWACTRGGSARKKAHFCDFIVIIIMYVNCCF